jgi:hypothetical protein
MTDADDRLERIENRLEMLLERQRLSRFDNLMFLVYPMILLGITLSLSASTQYEAIRTIMIWGTPLTLILDILRYGFSVGFGLTFVIFCIGYSTDSLNLRLFSIEALFTLLLSMTFVFLTLGMWQTLGGLFATFHGIFPSVAVRLLIVSPFLFALYGFVVGGVRRFVDRTASWFERSMPITFKQARISLKLYRTSKLPWPITRLISKVSWSVGVITYFIILAIAAWRGQLNGKVVYDAIYVAAFLITTEAIMLWRLWVQ